MTVPMFPGLRGGCFGRVLLTEMTLRVMAILYVLSSPFALQPDASMDLRVMGTTSTREYRTP